MKCKIEWDDEFVIQELNRSYYNKEYKDYRMKLLLEHELSRMKESAGKAEARKKIKEIEEMECTLRSIIQNYKSKLDRLKDAKEDIEKKGNLKDFIMKCPDMECRGFLTSEYKCGVCNKITCSDCFVIKN